MIKGSQLVAHADSTKVSYDDLRNYDTPAATRYWKPVPHVELVDVLKSELANREILIVHEDYAVSGNGLKLFGTFDTSLELGSGIAASLGFRHANDKHISLQTVGGGRVFVCDNMMLSGDVTILKHKHTWNFSLRDLVQRGLDAWQKKRVNMIDSISRMQNTPLNDTTAQAILGKALYDGVTTFQTFKIAYDLYFTRAVAQPEQYPDCAPRTAYGLHNAYTRALKESTPNVAFNTNIELGKLFKL